MIRNTSLLSKRYNRIAFTFIISLMVFKQMPAPLSKVHDMNREEILEEAKRILTLYNLRKGDASLNEIVPLIARHNILIQMQTLKAYLEEDTDGSIINKKNSVGDTMLIDAVRKRKGLFEDI